MTSKKSFSISLRISSKNMNCAGISEKLGWQSSKQFERGDSFRSGAPSKTIREESLWIYDLPIDKKECFEEQIDKLVDMILEKKTKFQEILNECDLDIFCGYTTYNGQGGFALRHGLMQELSLLKIDLLVDFYSI